MLNPDIKIFPGTAREEECFIADASRWLIAKALHISGARRTSFVKPGVVFTGHARLVGDRPMNGEVICSL